jgi:hypothetical protein
MPGRPERRHLQSIERGERSRTIRRVSLKGMAATQEHPSLTSRHYP